MKNGLALCIVVGLVGLSNGSPGAPSSPKGVTLVRLPHGGIQPEAIVDDRAVLHVLYLSVFVWTEGTAWARGGSVAWLTFDESGRPSGPIGRAPDLPVWSFATSVARPDGTFVVFY
jgi:hypothetical protein